MWTLPFRQVHLDFHTSEQIRPIAGDFDPAQFAQTLAKAHVDSVTCFSRCHHGMIYHPTKFTQARHPGLSRNLLGEQIEACHEHGIRVPIYISVGFDELQARTIPEWLEVTPEGRRDGPGPFEPGWKKLCLNTPYVDYVMAQTQEVLDMFEVDGLFFDIIHQGQCVCQYCLEDMLAENLAPELEAHRIHFAAMVLERFKRRMSGAVREQDTECSIFYNAGHVTPGIRATLDTYTHLELESLPSGGWGYDHFPFTVRYARNLGLDVLGMTGKFHKSWGDFGSFKNEAALEYECFTALAEGASCSIGDQLHPRGKPDAATYECIGRVYRSVEEKQPWCENALPLTEIAVLHPDSIVETAPGRHMDPSGMGAHRMLIESHHMFDLVDQQMDWSRYKVLILPDKITLDQSLAETILGYLEQGGTLIASHESGLDRETRKEFMLDAIPVRLSGRGRFSRDYLVALGNLNTGIPESQHIMYEPGLEVEPGEAAEVLAEVHWPYFERSWDHFCSHAQTPVEKASRFPAVVRGGGVIYFAHPIFRMFAKHGSRVYKQLFLNALSHLLPEPLVETDAPSTAHITLLDQPFEKRHVLHVLHYVPERRYADLDTIEDILPLRDVQIGIKLPSVERVYLAPSEEPLDYRRKDDRIWLTVPEVHGHAMVGLDY